LDLNNMETTKKPSMKKPPAESWDIAYGESSRVG
jgi:hypothetical protein